MRLPKITVKLQNHNSNTSRPTKSLKIRGKKPKVPCSVSAVVPKKAHYHTSESFQYLETQGKTSLCAEEFVVWLIFF